MELKSGVLEEKYKFTIITILLAGSSFLSYYCHAVLQTETIFTQFFYLPIILASIWWRKKGIVVAVFLATLLIFSHFILRPDLPVASDYLRSFLFIVISIVVAILNEQIVKSEMATEIVHTELLQTFNNTSDGIQVINKDFNVLRINDTFSVLSGMSKDKSVGKKCYEVFINSLCHTPDCPLTRILGGEKLVECDMEKESTDGTKIFCLLTATPFQKPDSELIGIVENFRDITERKKSEEKQRETKDYLNNIIESSLDSIIVGDNKGYITRVNKSFLKLIGYSNEEVIGKHVAELSVHEKGTYESTTGKQVAIGKKFRDDAKEKTETLFEKGKISNWESYYLRKDKQIVPVEMNIVFLYDKGGNITRAVGIIRDITARRKVECILRGKVAELSVLNDIAQVIVGSLNLDSILKDVLLKILEVADPDLDCGIILLLSKEADKLVLKGPLGFKSDALKDGAEIALDDDVAGKVVMSKESAIVVDTEKYDMPVAELLRNEGIKSCACIPIVTKDKVHGTINLGSHKQHYFNPDEINFFTLIANQIGLAIENARLFEETKNALEELKQTQSFLLQSEKMASIGQLAAGVAHEINNPVGYVRSNLGSLDKYSNKVLELFKKYEEGLAALKNNGSKELTSFYEEMDGLKKKLKMDFIMKDFQKIISDSLEGTNRIKKIVADLKSFSRVDQAEFKRANINEGLKSTLNVVWNELKYKCTVEKDYGDLPQIYCNLGQLNQVFMNLLVNAAQAIEEKGTMKISTRHVNGKSEGSDRGQDCIEIKIADTGKGISEDKLGRIFDPFFTTKDVGKGTGLGLSIAYDIIEKHKGKITVQSVVGKGTAFTIMLPLLNAETTEKELKGANIHD